MLARLRHKSSFAHNILVLMAGTGMGQLMPILVTPILTRLFTPQDFGLLAMYTAMTGTLAVFLTGRYEMSVVLPKRDNEAVAIVKMTITIACIMALISLLIVALVESPLVDLFKLGDDGWLLYLVPVGAFISAVYDTLNYWLNRKKMFYRMSVNRVVQGGFISGFQLIGSIFGKAISLVIADISGRFLTSTLLLKVFLKSSNLKADRRKSLVLAKKYSNYPLNEAPASLFNILAFQSPYLLLPIFFTPTMAGLYFLVFRAVMLPVGLLGVAVLEVFRSRATEEFHEQGNCRGIFRKTFTVLFLMSVLPAAVLGIWGQELFGLVFGAEWRQAGLYAQFLAPLAMLRLVSAPLSYTFFIANRLDLDMALQALFLILTVLSIYIGSIYNDPLLVVILLSTSGCLFYSLQLLVSYKLANGK